MTQIMEKEINRLKKSLLELCAVVEESVQQAVKSLQEGNLGLARELIAKDDQIDLMEVELEEECLKVLALHQPVAIDLRFLVAVLKINNDLERIGDLATNIAERTVALGESAPIVPPFDVAQMARTSQQMLEMSLTCLVQMDTRLARKVLDLDDSVDNMHSQNFRLIKERILQNPDELDRLTQYLTVSRHLERIADLATNIAEDVYYMIQGEIVRHTSDWALDQ